MCQNHAQSVDHSQSSIGNYVYSLNPIITSQNRRRRSKSSTFNSCTNLIFYGWNLNLCKILKAVECELPIDLRIVDNDFDCLASKLWFLLQTDIVAAYFYISSITYL